MTYRTQLRTPSPARRTGAYSLLLALGLALAACGAGSDGELAAGDTTPVADAPTTTEAALSGSGLPSLSDEVQNAAADDSDSMADDEPVDQDEAVELYVACLQTEGIDTDAVEAMSIEDEEAYLSTREFLDANAVCEPILEEAFGDFELSPEMEAQLADRSAELAACGRDVLGVDVPDDVLFLPEDDPRMIELGLIDTTPEQDAAIEACAEEILGDILDDDGNLITEASE